MRGFLAVASRDIASRRIVFVAAALAALVPFAVPLLRGMKGTEALEARTATALILSAAFLYGIAGLIGSTVIPRGIADRRVGFDFARPLSALAMWVGTLAATLLLAVGSAAIVWIPAALAGDAGFWPNLVELTGLSLPWPIIAVAAAILLFGLSSVVGVALRSRSWIALVDLVLLLAISLAVVSLLARLLPAAPFVLYPRIQTLLAAFAIAALLAAGFVGLSRGRTDIRAAHRAQSIVLWGTTAIAVLGLHVWVSWLNAATPRDLVTVGSAFPALRGSWVTVYGQARQLEAQFLYDVATGRFRRFPWQRYEVISPDGGRAVWLDSRGRSTELWSWRLDDPSGRPERSSLSWTEPPRGLILDDSGSRVAVIREEELAFHEVDSGRLLGAAKLGVEWPRGFFLGNRFRLLEIVKAENRTSSLRISEVDILSGLLTRTGEVSDLRGWAFAMADPAGDRLLITELEDRRVRLVAASDGHLLAMLASDPTPNRTARFLSDGRIVLAERNGGDLRLRLFARDGSPTRAIDIPDGERVSLGGEAAPGQLVVGVGDFTDQKIYLVELDSGDVRPVAEHLTPALRHAGFFGPANAVVKPGSDATKLFLGSEGTLVRLDPLTGDRKTILPALER